MSLAISSRVNPTASSAAILAIGNPVALEASADERLTRGFISITNRRPVSGSTANWTFEPPVSTPMASSTAIASSRISWYSRSLSVCTGSHRDRIPGVDTHWIEVLYGAYDDRVAGSIPHHLQLELFPTEY